MKTKISLIIFGLTVATFISTTAIAGLPGGLLPVPGKAKENAKIENSAAITKTNNDWALNPPGLESVTFIHYEKDFAKPPWAGGGDRGKEAKCYDFLGKSVKWNNLPVNYVIDPDNPDGLSESFITSAISKAAEEWDANTGAELFGTYSVDKNSSWDSSSPDGRNEFVFDNYPENGVIAVTVIWGYFSGPPSTRGIVEFDILFDTDFTWGDATSNPALMDLQNIATHEIGHGAGLGDLYDSACAEETMYGYSENGETKKRDLNTGDISGIQELYGA